MPDVTLTETITISERDITDEERRLSHQYNTLISECIRWARKQMVYGTHATQLAVTKSVLSSASRLAALDNKTQTETHRIAFQQLLTEMATVEPTAIEAASISTNDKD